MSTVGASAPSQHTLNLDALLSTTLFNYRKVLVDNIFEYNAFLAALREFGGIDYQDGGERIAIPLMYEKTSTTKSYRGYEQLEVVPQDGFTTAFFPWVEIADTISISRREERQNSGEARILNLLKSKIQQAEMSIKRAVNQQLVEGNFATAGTAACTPGNDGKDLLPLNYFLPKDNTADPSGTGVDNVGNISRNTYSWWRPVTAVMDNATADTGNAFALSVTTWKGLHIALKRMWNHCSRGADGSGPNIVLMTQAVFEEYEAGLDDKLRYGTTKIADMGFDSIKLKGAACIWDELVPNVDEGYPADNASFATNDKQGTAFFLNTKFYKLVIDRQTDFVTTPFIEPENQTAKVAKILFMGNATLSNPRKVGVCYAIQSDIVS